MTALVTDEVLPANERYATDFDKGRSRCRPVASSR
jgi:hypothetical protein